MRHTVDGGIFGASHSCIFSAGDTSEATGIGLAEPRDTS